jgi:hypothetical protein
MDTAAATLPTAPLCTAPRCGAPLSEHIGGKSCVVGAPSTARTIYDLPITRWAWREDGRDRRA